MKELLDKLLQRHKYLEPTAEEELRRQVNVLYGAFTGLIGPEKMVLRASKYSALSYVHSEDPRRRIVGLQRLVYEDASYDKVPSDEEVVDVLNELENVLAEMLARQAVEERLKRKSASAWKKSSRSTYRKSRWSSSKRNSTMWKRRRRKEAGRSAAS